MGDDKYDRQRLEDYSLEQMKQSLNVEICGGVQDVHRCGLQMQKAGWLVPCLFLLLSYEIRSRQVVSLTELINTVAAISREIIVFFKTVSVGLSAPRY